MNTEAPIHIKITNDDNRSWCDQPLNIKWHFKDAEHAALNGLLNTNGVDAHVCADCVLKIVGSLKNNLSKTKKSIDETVNKNIIRGENHVAT